MKGSRLAMAHFTQEADSIIIVITLYNLCNIIYIFSPTEPNNLRALIKACFLKIVLAFVIEPVLSNVLEAAVMAVIHFFPDLFFLFLIICFVLFFLFIFLVLAVII